VENLGSRAAWRQFRRKQSVGTHTGSGDVESRTGGRRNALVIAQRQTAGRDCLGANTRAVWWWPTGHRLGGPSERIASPKCSRLSGRRAVRAYCVVVGITWVGLISWPGVAQVSMHGGDRNPDHSPASEPSESLTAENSPVPADSATPKEAESSAEQLSTELRQAIDTRRFALRPYLLEGRIGAGNVVGLVGVTAAVDLLGRVVVGAGAGLNVQGLQLGAYVRGRPAVFLNSTGYRLHAVALELGYCAGPYSPWAVLVGDAVTPSGIDRWDWAHWIQPSVGWETRSWNGVNAVVAVGYAFPVHSSGYRCVGDYPCRADLFAIPTISASLGYAIGS
jgi:hypothetical protein